MGAQEHSRKRLIENRVAFDPFVAFGEFADKSAIESRKLRVQESCCKPIGERNVMQRIHDGVEAELKHGIHGTIHPTPVPLAGLMLYTMPGNRISQFGDPCPKEQIEVLPPVLDVSCGSENVMARAMDFNALKST